MKYIWIVLVVLACSTAAFYGGMRYAQASRSSLAGQRQFRGLGRGPGGMPGNGFVTGQVLSKDAQSITVKMRDGGSKIILLAPSTTVSKSTSGSVDDVRMGKDIVVTGTENSDGSVSAQNIQIRPGMPQPLPAQ